jgi:ATP-dependent Clp protease protease subunit
MNDFEKYAKSEHHVNPLTLGRYASSTTNPPIIIEERKLNTASTDIFSRLMMDRIIFLGSSIDDEVANIIQAQLLYLASADPDADISMYINSPGGVVFSGLSIYDTMQIISPDVSTICTGWAASMGAILLCAGAEGKRYALPHSKIMIHQPLGGAYGQASDILIEAKEIEKCRHDLYNIISTHTGQSLKKVAKDADRDYWMTAAEALKYGMIDKVLVKK